MSISEKQGIGTDESKIVDSLYKTAAAFFGSIVYGITDKRQGIVYMDNIDVVFFYQFFYIPICAERKKGCKRKAEFLKDIHRVKLVVIAVIMNYIMSSMRRPE